MTNVFKMQIFLIDQALVIWISHSSQPTVAQIVLKQRFLKPENSTGWIIDLLKQSDHTSRCKTIDCKMIIFSEKAASFVNVFI